METALLPENWIPHLATLMLFLNTHEKGKKRATSPRCHGWPYYRIVLTWLCMASLTSFALTSFLYHQNPKTDFWHGFALFIFNRYTGVILGGWLLEETMTRLFTRWHLRRI